MSVIATYKQSFKVSTATLNQPFTFAPRKYKTKTSQKIRISVASISYRAELADIDLFEPQQLYLDGLFNGHCSNTDSNGRVTNSWFLGDIGLGVGGVDTVKYGHSTIDYNALIVDDIPHDQFRFILSGTQLLQFNVSFNIELLE
jgi:hypothetical protein